MTGGQGPLCPDMPVKGGLSRTAYCAGNHGASSLDTEELTGQAGETGGWGWRFTQQHCWRVCGESGAFLLVLKCCCFFDQALREWVYNIFNSSKRGKSAKNGSTLHLRFLFAVTLVHEIGRPWGKSMSATRSMKALKVSCLCKFQKALLEITNRYTLKQQQPCSTEVWSLSVTSSVGCCHGNEWHGRAWGLRRVLHMLSCCCHPVRAQTTREERVCCITSFANKKHSVSKAAQTVCEAF